MWLIYMLNLIFSENKVKMSTAVVVISTTTITSLPWLILYRFFSPNEILQITQENKCLGIWGDISLFYHDIVCSV